MRVIPNSAHSSAFAALLMNAAVGCAGAHNHGPVVEELPSLTAEESFEVAMFQARRGDFFRAEQYLITARALGAEDATVAYWLVRVCVSAGRYQAAIRHAYEHLSRNPANWRLRLVVASLHEALGEISKAREELEDVLLAEPNRGFAHYKLGVLSAVGAGLTGDARRHLERYLELEPSGSHSAEVRALLERALPSQSAVPDAVTEEVR